MAEKIPAVCPICSNELVISRLSCHHCGLELTKDFPIHPLFRLEEEDLLFIEHFIETNGNLKQLQLDLGLSYVSARRHLTQIQEKLGLNSGKTTHTSIEVILKQLPVYQDESLAVQLIKKKLNKSNGIATLTLPRGKTFQIYYEEYGNGLYATNVPHNHPLTWKAFDSAIELLKKRGGTAEKGNAMKAKLGSPGLTLDTVEGYVAYNAYGVKKGESTLRTISALSCILEWAGVCKNGYGYLSLIKNNV